MKMGEDDWLALRFEENRGHLRAVAYRMLGSLSEAEDAVQESWLRLSRSDSERVEILRGWLTTVVARVCLDLLRSRKSRAEVSLSTQFPEPIVSREGDAPNPEHEALLADSVGLALLIVLEKLDPGERLAFVLHDMFAVSFDDIASILGRSTTAARQLASRARRRVRRASAVPERNLERQREVVNAFFAAVRGGSLEALVAVLDPDVVLHADRAAEGMPIEVHGARAVAQRAFAFSRLAPLVQPVIVNGAAGVIVAPGGRMFSLKGFTVMAGRIVEIDILTDPARLGRLDLPVLDGQEGVLGS
jgi:RNA polymerase sigma factor (sigma-70 family)